MWHYAQFFLPIGILHRHSINILCIGCSENKFTFILQKGNHQQAIIWRYLKAWNFLSSGRRLGVSGRLFPNDSKVPSECLDLIPHWHSSVYQVTWNYRFSDTSGVKDVYNHEIYELFKEMELTRDIRLRKGQRMSHVMRLKNERCQRKD